MHGQQNIKKILVLTQMYTFFIGLFVLPKTKL